MKAVLYRKHGGYEQSRVVVDSAVRCFAPGGCAYVAS